MAELDVPDAQWLLDADSDGAEARVERVIAHDGSTDEADPVDLVVTRCRRQLPATTRPQWGSHG